MHISVFREPRARQGASALTGEFFRHPIKREEYLYPSHENDVFNPASGRVDIADGLFLTTALSTFTSGDERLALPHSVAGTDFLAGGRDSVKYITL